MTQKLPAPAEPLRANSMMYWLTHAKAGRAHDHSMYMDPDVYAYQPDFLKALEDRPAWCDLPDDHDRGWPLRVRMPFVVALFTLFAVGTHYANSAAVSGLGLAFAAAVTAYLCALLVEFIEIRRNRHWMVMVNKALVEWAEEHPWAYQAMAHSLRDSRMDESTFYDSLVSPATPYHQDDLQTTAQVYAADTPNVQLSAVMASLAFVLQVLLSTWVVYAPFFAQAQHPALWHAASAIICGTVAIRAYLRSDYKQKCIHNISALLRQLSVRRIGKFAHDKT